VVNAVPKNSTSKNDLSIRRMQSNKIATSNLFIVDERTQDIDEMTNLLFEDFSATELINLSRHDSLNGQDIIYQPIKNITQLAFEYNPQNILSFSQTEKDLIENYILSIERYIPSEPTNNLVVYLEDGTNDIIIEVSGIREDERVEVEFLTYTSVEDDTIYIT
jgi:hypothetical protein